MLKMLKMPSHILCARLCSLWLLSMDGCDCVTKCVSAGLSDGTKNRLTKRNRQIRSLFQSRFVHKHTIPTIFQQKIDESSK